jgi:hypothetical protein
MRYALPLLILAVRGAVGAQSVELDSVQTASVRAALFTVQLESPIRIRTVGQSILEGRLAARSDSDVVVRHGSVSRSAAINRIEEVWRSAPNYKSGAIVGGVTGVVVGGLLGGTVAVGLCDQADCHGAFGEGAVAGAGFFGLVGAIVGLGFGSITHHWDRLWPKGSS